MTKPTHFRGIDLKNIISISEIYEANDDNVFNPEICYWIEIKHTPDGDPNDILTFYQGFRYRAKALQFHKQLTELLGENNA